MERCAQVIRLHHAAKQHDDLPDAALVAACGRGEMTALAGLYDRHAPRVARFLTRLRHVDAHETADLVQEVFLAARRSAHTYRAECAVSTWLLANAGNLARVGARSAARRNAALAHVRTHTAFTVVDPDTEDQALAREQIALLQSVLASLPRDLRVVFVMSELEEASGAEAARVLNLRQGTLYRRLHDARRKLRYALDRGASCD